MNMIDLTIEKFIGNILLMVFLAQRLGSKNMPPCKLFAKMWEDFSKSHKIEGSHISLKELSYKKILGSNVPEWYLWGWLKGYHN